MTALSRWFAPVALAAGLGAAATALPTPAHADDLARVIVDIADVIVRNNTPYWRYGNYGYNDRLVVVHDRWGRPTYYRNVPRYADYRYRPAPPPRYYANDRRYYDRDCNRHGKCKVSYYDGRYDRRYDRGYDHRWDNRYYGRDRGHGRGHGRGRDHDDD